MTEIVEQDTEVSEEIPNLNLFLRQGAPDDQDCAQVGYIYNRKVFDGWVKQPSACCGASSVAGAWNTLGSIHRRNGKALNHTHILTAYQSMFIDLIAKGRASFERRLGAPLANLISEIDSELAKRGRSIGGKKGANASKVAVLGALKKIARMRLRSREEEEGKTNTISEGKADNSGKERGLEACSALGYVDKMPDAVDCIIELFMADGVSLDKSVDAKDDDGSDEKSAVEPNKKAESKKEGEEEESDDEADSEEEEDSTPASMSISISSGRSGKKDAAGAAGLSAGLWEWKKDLMKIIQNTAGLRKLTADRPSTAAIGNWGILQVVDRLGQWTDVGNGIQARLFMGKRKNPRTKIDVFLSRKDTPAVIQTQWDAMRSALARSDTVLLFHLKNHYALIFAAREWCLSSDPDGVAPVRQILTARKGQRPTAWVSFDEARETMLGWEGYKIMAISRTDTLTTEAMRSASFLVPEEYDDKIVKY